MIRAAETRILLLQNSVRFVNSFEYLKIESNGHERPFFSFGRQTAHATIFIFFSPTLVHIAHSRRVWVSFDSILRWNGIYLLIESGGPGTSIHLFIGAKFHTEKNVYQPDKSYQPEEHRGNWKNIASKQTDENTK